MLSCTLKLYNGYFKISFLQLVHSTVSFPPVSFEPVTADVVHFAETIVLYMLEIHGGVCFHGVYLTSQVELLPTTGSRMRVQTHVWTVVCASPFMRDDITAEIVVKFSVRSKTLFFCPDQNSHCQSFMDFLNEHKIKLFFPVLCLSIMLWIVFWYCYVMMSPHNTALYSSLWSYIQYMLNVHHWQLISALSKVIFKPHVFLCAVTIIYFKIKNLKQ
jgi:hypothetical protein